MVAVDWPRSSVDVPADLLLELALQYHVNDVTKIVGVLLGVVTGLCEHEGIDPDQILRECFAKTFGH